MTERRFGRRLGATIVLALGAVVAFAVVGGTGLAGGLAKPSKAQYGPGQYQYQGKVIVCHKSKVTIRISVNAWPAHERHGDSMGPCTAAAVKAAKLKAAHGHASQGEKAAAKKATHAGKGHKTSTADESSSDDAAEGAGTSQTHGPPAGRGNGNGNGNGHGKND